MEFGVIEGDLRREDERDDGPRRQMVAGVGAGVGGDVDGVGRSGAARIGADPGVAPGGGGGACG